MQWVLKGYVRGHVHDIAKQLDWKDLVDLQKFEVRLESDISRM
jgi:hypothetical protein